MTFKAKVTLKDSLGVYCLEGSKAHTWKGHREKHPENTPKIPRKHPDNTLKSQDFQYLFPMPFVGMPFAPLWVYIDERQITHLFCARL